MVYFWGAKHIHCLGTLSLHGVVMLSHMVFYGIVHYCPIPCMVLQYYTQDTFFIWWMLCHFCSPDHSVGVLIPPIWCAPVLISREVWESCQLPMFLCTWPVSDIGPLLQGVLHTWPPPQHHTASQLQTVHNTWPTSYCHPLPGFRPEAINCSY